MVEAGFGSSFTGAGAGKPSGNKVKLPWGGVVVPNVGMDGDVGPVVLEDGVTVGVDFNKLSCLYFSSGLFCGQGESPTSGK
jgi:hypothetical protein